MLTRLRPIAKVIKSSRIITSGTPIQSFSNLRDFLNDPIDTVLPRARNARNSIRNRYNRTRDNWGITDMFDNLAHLFDDDTGQVNSSYFLPSNIHETAKEYEIHVDLPGVLKDAIDISVDQHVLTIKSQRRANFSSDDDATQQQQDQDQPRDQGTAAMDPTSASKPSESEKSVAKSLGSAVTVKKQTPSGPVYHRREIYYGTTTRSFILPDDADPGSINAKYENGVLYVHIKKKPAKEQDDTSKRIYIE